MFLAKKNSGVYFIALLAITPLLLWWPSTSLNSISNLLLSLGQAAGLVGATLFAINFILSAQITWLESFFDGLNRMYIVHHLLGAISFILLLTHPLLLTLANLFFSREFAIQLLLPSLNNLPVLYGIIALTLTIALLTITFFLHFKYEIWKLTHKFLGLALFFASLHIYFIPSTVAINLPLRTYMLGISILGLGLFFYHTVLGKYFVKKLKYTVKSAQQLNQDILEIILIPKPIPLKFIPGQFVFITVKSTNISSETHPFSITSAPTDKYLSLATKSLGDYTKTLKLLKPGTEITVRGAYGRFSYTQSLSPNQIWIAGGIGITPFLSMIRSLPKNHPYTIDLYISVSKSPEMIYKNELTKRAASLPRLRIFPFYTQIDGRLTANKVAKNTDNLTDTDVFICGPLPMMKSLRTQFRQLGVKNAHLHTEEFALR